MDDLVEKTQAVQGDDAAKSKSKLPGLQNIKENPKKLLFVIGIVVLCIVIYFMRNGKLKEKLSAGSKEKPGKSGKKAKSKKVDDDDDSDDDDSKTEESVINNLVTDINSKQKLNTAGSGNK
jgi:hypothetical protein